MNTFLALASVVCACVPMIGFVSVMWWLDRYHREPVWLVAVTFLWGALGAVVPAILFSTAVQVSTNFALGAIGFGEPGAWFLPVVVAPIIEEPAKAAILLLVMWSRHFDNATDGFVYGAAAGLGFAMSENLLYFVSMSGDVAGWGYTVVIRTFYSAVMHATATSIVGAALGLARFRGCFWMGLSGLVGLAIAWGIHMLWNALISVGVATGTGVPVVVDLLLFPVEFFLVFVVFQICLWQESAIIRHELRDEPALPAGHADLLASWRKRLFPSWVPAGVNPSAYIHAATTLAMRKRQVRMLGRGAAGFYEQDLRETRTEIGRLLARSARIRPSV